MPSDPFAASVESMTQDGRGVAHVEGKATFIDGALPGEDVLFCLTSRKRRFDEGRVVEVVTPSPSRTEPRCDHFGVCGGCSLQHQDAEAQILDKQQVLLDALAHVGGVKPEEVLPPLHGPVWGYRSRARLSVRHVVKKDRVLVGFREKRSRYVADLRRCEVLNPCVGDRIAALAELIGGLDAHDRIAQIEVAASDDECALVLRNLAPLEHADRERLARFESAQGVRFYLQPGGRDSIEPLNEPAPVLRYALPGHDISLRFSPSDFVQVNPELNRDMIRLALELLDPGQNAHVLELFCGLGNFTLPMARKVASIDAVEGDAGLIERARENAAENGIDNVRYHVCDLAKELPPVEWVGKSYDRLLLDPPRTGAIEIVRQAGRWNAGRIVYVSCNPATLARDADELVNRQGYRLLSAGVMDMFPHTAHVESIALFERDTTH